MGSLRRLAIIGAGHAGSQAAISLREAGYDGGLVLLSDEPELPYHRPPLSKTYLTADVAALQPLRSEALYDRHAIDLRLGTRVTGIDRRGGAVVEANGAETPFDALVIATGTRARRLSVPGCDAEGVFYLRSAADAQALRASLPGAERVVVVGGGFIGLEVAASLVAAGRRVTVIEAADRLLARLVSPVVGDFLRDAHTSAGVRFLLSRQVASIEVSDGRAAGVRTTDGVTLAADLVVVGIGAEVNDEIAAHAGIATANGIVVGDDLGTSVPGIHALGDAASYVHWQTGQRLRLESVQNATDQARHLAACIVRGPQPYRKAPWFWSDQGPIKFQMAGIASGADEQVLCGKIEDGAFALFHLRQRRLVAVESINRPAEHVLARRMLESGVTPDRDAIEAGAPALKQLLAGTMAAVEA